MKRILIATLLGCATAAGAQVKNPGFETGRDTAASMPQSWGYRNGHGYAFALDGDIRHSGSKSLRITYTPDSTAPTFAPVSQLLPIEPGPIRRLAVTAWIKMENVGGSGGGFWCQIWSKDNKQIGFKNIDMQGTTLKGTSDWTKYSLNLVVNSDCSKLLIGGYLGKGGTIWYDDVSIETLPPTDIPPSKEARQYSDAVVRIVREHSIYASTLNWDTIKSEVKMMLSGAKTYADAAEVSSYLLGKLRSQGDNHSFIMSAQRTEQHSRENVDGREPSVRMLDHHTGYVYVPGFMSVNDAAGREFAERIQAGIRSLDSAAPVTRWVVDLRENSGGNMYPMIAGLGPLIGNGDAGYFVTASEKQPWYYRNGDCGQGKHTSIKLKNPYTLKTASPKIAVLIGSGTGSSGEMTTVSFIGKPNTRLFGQATGGFSTANGMYKLPDGSMLLLANSYVADRNGTRYLGKIQPDELLDEQDDAIAAAMKWLEPR